MNHQISLCYHPTTVVFVDDNLDFINSIRAEIKRILHCKFYSEPLNALDFFKNYYRIKPFTQRCFVKPADEQTNHLFYNVNLRVIHQEIRTAERFEEVAVAVIDYTMPDMNGVELSQQLRAINPAIRILLLTGEADHDTAVQLFNNGVIDKFVKKSTPELIKVLTQTIKELEDKYFINLSQVIINKMNGSSDNLKRLGDISFVNFFNQLCHEKLIVEYYLIDEQGSFLLIDGKGASYRLVIVDNSEMENFYESATTEKAPKAILDVLSNKVKMPVFLTENQLWTHPADWETYLYPVQRLNGLNTYYYTLIENPISNEGCTEQIVPYKTYLKKAC